MSNRTNLYGFGSLPNMYNCTYSSIYKYMTSWEFGELDFSHREKLENLSLRVLYTLASEPDEVKELGKPNVFLCRNSKTETCFHFEDILNDITHRELEQQNNEGVVVLNSFRKCLKIASAPEEVKEDVAKTNHNRF